LNSLLELTYIEIRTIELGGDVISRSVSLTTFDSITYLMIALGDGFLINYTYDLVCI
jgi:hypothetical protein